ncbi:ATP synthase F1 subunit gamma [Luteibaculum oceani]|uniref:ATP synthase gamma chain n=1 Tax=Luteibaculum oceani TaxID=1294296 RepID=A0A5C6VJV6_9FLAO|nr:ATP synthase F1 subunit gamma [Luteibaculum oceani]TXC85290.1 ATP synthase F1 subunit gamma [Luteibaculum oceani]
MANLKEVRTRITSVNSTKQITSAMKMVSAAKLKRAQDAITQMRPYANKLKEIIGNVSATLDISEGALSVERPKNKIIVVAITSNRGLCGAFNNNVIKTTKSVIEANAHAEVKVLPLGKKANDFFSKTPFKLSTEEFNYDPIAIFDELTFENAADICQQLMDAFQAEKVDEVRVIYNQFKNAATQYVQDETLLPMQPEEKSDESLSSAEYIFNPSKEEIITSLIPQAIKLQLFKALLDSHAAEHGARMTAMHKATDNAGELLKELKLQYNKARQAAITNEILEICAGAEALNG